MIGMCNFFYFDFVNVYEINKKLLKILFRKITFMREKINKVEICFDIFIFNTSKYIGNDKSDSRNIKKILCLCYYYYYYLVRDCSVL